MASSMHRASLSYFFCLLLLILSSIIPPSDAAKKSKASPSQPLVCPGTSPNADYHQLITKAQSLANNRQTSEAKQCMILAAKREPTIPHTYCNLGQLHMQLNEFKEAATYFEECIKHKMDNPIVFYDLGNAYKSSNQPKKAIKAYEILIKKQPTHANGLHNLASVHSSLGNMKQSMEYYEKCLDVDPEHAACLVNLAVSYDNTGKSDAAFSLYTRALKVRPDLPELHNNLGNLYAKRKQYTEASSYFETAVEKKPQFAQAWANLASAYKASDRLSNALNTYNRFLEYYNTNSHLFASKEDAKTCGDVFYGMGSLYLEVGNIGEAVTALEKAVEVRGNDQAYYWNNLGIAYHRLNNYEQALRCYKRAVEILPEFPQGLTNIGNIYKATGRPNEAAEYFEAALAVNPSFAEALNNLAGLYSDHGMVEKSIEVYKQSIAAAASSSSNSMSLSSPLTNLLHSLTRICVWEDREQYLLSVQEVTEHELSISGLLVSDDYSQMIVSGSSREDGVIVVPAAKPLHALSYPFPQDLITRMAIAFSLDQQRIVEHMGIDSRPSSSSSISNNKQKKKLRVGYVSSDMGKHPVGFAIAGIFAAHKNHSTVTSYCYANKKDDGSLHRKLIEDGCDSFLEVHQLGTEQMRSRIRDDDQVDILVDLNGYTEGVRSDVFALQPASIQINFLGWCSTSGSSFLQYIVADRRVLPPPSARFFTERVFYMPHSYMPTNHKQLHAYMLPEYGRRVNRSPENGYLSISSSLSSSSSAVAGDVFSVSPFASKPIIRRSDWKLPEDKFIFANFNQHYKIEPSAFDMWINILKRCDGGSVMWILRFNPNAEKHLIAEAEARGVSRDRFIFTDLLPQDGHLLIKQLADVVLDTVLYSGHVTTTDLLWAGVPVISMESASFASRVSSGLAHTLFSSAASSEEEELMSCRDVNLVAKTATEYENMAVELYNNRSRLNHVRSCVEASRKSSALFDTDAYIRHLETGYQMAAMASKMQLDRLPHVIINER